MSNNIELKVVPRNPASSMSSSTQMEAVSNEEERKSLLETEKQEDWKPVLDTKKQEEWDSTHLKPRHTMFLSHNGVQKNFVEQLCVDLESAKQAPFFDKRPDSLPRGRNSRSSYSRRHGSVGWQSWWCRRSISPEASGPCWSWLRLSKQARARVYGGAPSCPCFWDCRAKSTAMRRGGSASSSDGTSGLRRIPGLTWMRGRQLCGSWTARMAWSTLRLSARWSTARRLCPLPVSSCTRACKWTRKRRGCFHHGC